MGSTIETAIVFTLVLLIIVTLITGPERVCLDSIGDLKSGIRELEIELEDSEVAAFYEVNGVNISDTSPERICTFMTGISDNFRLIYGGLSELAGGE